MSVRTIDSYTYHVDRFAKHFGRQPEDMDPEQIREFQLWMIQVNKSSWSQVNQAVCGLRFLYSITLSRSWVVQSVPYGKRPKSLPTVLGQEEVNRLIACVDHLKHRAVLLTDRHCPQCVGARRADWLAKTEKLLRSEVTYFQVVFTLPEQLSELALGNRSVLYKLLFGAAWKALSRSIREELGMQPAAAKVLHTWNQRLGHHPHIHALVPGSGRSIDGKSWIPCCMTKGTIHEPPKPFLVDNKRLGCSSDELRTRRKRPTRRTARIGQEVSAV